MFLRGSEHTQCPSGSVWEAGRGNGVDVLSRPVIIEDFAASCTKCQFSPGHVGKAVFFTTYTRPIHKSQMHRRKEGKDGLPRGIFYTLC